MMRVVVHQPDFVPYIGFFHRLISADIFVILDHVQISPRGWVHRDKIKTANGESWITLPVNDINGRSAICDVTLDAVCERHQRVLNLLEHNYRRASHFAEYAEFKRLYVGSSRRLVDLNILLLNHLMKIFGIDIECIKSSELDVYGSKSQLMANIVNRVGGTTYISGCGARNYHDDAPFDARGIVVEWQKFKHPVYKQQYGGFIPNLSSLDMLFNCGAAESRRLLREEC